MAATRFGRLYWPGASTFVGGDYTSDIGTAPGSVRVDFLVSDEAKLQRQGNLTFTDGVNTRILYDCIMDKGELADNGGGKVLRVNIWDRRWKWRLGSFSGRYNLRDERGILISAAVSPLKIAEAILNYMGERNYAIDLPAGVSQAETPFIEFDEVRPDQALEELAERFGRIVVFQPWKNRVVITQPGNGADLPNLPYRNIGIAIDPAELPEKIEVRGAPITYQCVFRLVPAAKQLDGAIVPIDMADYRPVGGWGLSRSRAFRDVVTPALKDPTSGISFGVATTEEVVATARECIWKYFRFSVLEPVNGQGPIVIPGLENDAPGLKVTTPYQLDFLDGIVYADTKDPTKKPYMMPPEVYGSVYKGAVPFFNPYKSNDLTIPSDSFRGVGFAVDNDRKLLISDRYLFNVDATDPTNPVAIPPVLYCLISVNVRDENGKLVRYSKDRTINRNVKTLPQVVMKEDAQRVRMVEYDHSTWEIKKTTGNSETVDKILDYYLDAEVTKLQTKRTASREFAGFIPIDPDGAIMQVSYSFGDDAPTMTTASLNRTHRPWVPDFQYRRFQQRIKSFIDRPYQFLNRNGGGEAVMKPAEIKFRGAVE